MHTCWGWCSVVTLQLAAHSHRWNGFQQHLGNFTFHFTYIHILSRNGVKYIELYLNANILRDSNANTFK